MIQMDPIKELEIIRTRLLEELNNLEKALSLIQETYPGLFAKRVGEFSIADKIRFSGDLIEFIKVRDQYALSNTQGR